MKQSVLLIFNKNGQEEVEEGLDGGELSTQMRGKVI